MSNREVNRWGMYSWANHGWSASVNTVLIGPWLLTLATTAAAGPGGASDGDATLFGFGPFTLRAEAYPSFMITVVSLLQVVLLPMFGAAADARGIRRKLLAVTCVIGALCTASLGLVGPGSNAGWLYAGLLFLLGTIVFGANDVVYNAFLPQLVPPSERDWASGRGFVLGYLGAGLVLSVSLALLGLHDVAGLTESAAVRWCFVLAGLWWAGFGLWAIAGISEHRGAITTRPSLTGLRELADALRMLRRMPHSFRFLLAFLFITDGMSAVTGLASTYITHELFGSDAGAAAGFLFGLILMIQFLAVGGSWFWPRVSPRLGSKRTILITLVLWCGVVVYAYAAMRTLAEAVVLGVVIGAVMGGTQALTRSVFSQLIPIGRESTFFGLYAVVDKGTSWVAPLLFTLVVNATGSYRQAILSLIVIFLAGIALLLATNIDRARRESTADG